MFYQDFYATLILLQKYESKLHDEFCIVVYRLCKSNLFFFKVSNNFDSTSDFLRSSIAIPAGRLYINVAAAVVAVADFLLWLPPASPELRAVGIRGQGGKGADPLTPPFFLQ